jgi:hypothetical protein
MSFGQERGDRDLKGSWWWVMFAVGTEASGVGAIGDFLGSVC